MKKDENITYIKNDENIKCKTNQSVIHNVVINDVKRKNIVETVDTKVYIPLHIIFSCLLVA